MPAQPQPLADNPYGEAFVNLADDGRRFRILQDGVGQFTQGKVVSAKDLGPGATLQRMVDLGAIAELTASEVQALGPQAQAATEEASQRRFDAQWSTGSPHTEPLAAENPPPEPSKAAAAPESRDLPRPPVSQPIRGEGEPKKK